MAVDEQNRVAVFSLPTDADVQLSSDRASFFLVQTKYFYVHAMGLPKELQQSEYYIRSLKK